MRILLNDLNPISSEFFNSWQDFKKLSGKPQALTILATVLLSVLSIGFLAIPTFRFMVGRFTKLNAHNLPPQAKKANTAATKTFKPPAPVTTFNGSSLPPFIPGEEPAMQSSSVYFGQGNRNNIGFMSLPNDVLRIIAKDTLSKQKAEFPLGFVCRRLRNIVQTNPERTKINDAVMNAISTGSLSQLQWYYNKVCHFPLFPELCNVAANNGHLSILQWLRQGDSNRVPPRPICPWDERTCHAAARGGHLSVLQWARDNGCPWGMPVHAQLLHTEASWRYYNGLDKTAALGMNKRHAAMLLEQQAAYCNRLDKTADLGTNGHAQMLQRKATWKY